ncbi:unnamed protein product [Eruca vesicaria subsp. sativa]|uniref:LIM zinc-binding domain-containing protein n=1 Tax=Eruca vesicaria subsp. sativa TaxID=29727 RepID=A0ABC8JLA3_ERUVS|nr:unnamed protein product [Eruca vesicaria subsp. sativa]
MWCLSCFKPSTSEDPFEAETNLALEVSREEADTQEAQLLASALQESSRLHQQLEDEQKRRTRELEKETQPAKIVVDTPKDKGKSKQFEEQVKKDEQVAQDLQNRLNKMAFEESPALHNNGKDEQFAKTSKRSKERRKSKQFEGEQVKKDEQVAQDLQNLYTEISYKENTGLEDNSVLDNEDEQYAKNFGKSLKVKGKERILEDEQVKKDEELAARVHESLNMHVKKDEELASRSSLDEDVQRTIWESLKKGKGKIKDEVEENGNLPKINPPPPPSMCGGCNFEIEHGRSVVDVLGVLWHLECLWCDACHNSIAVHEVETHVSNSRGKFHKACYERYCYVCEERKMKQYNHHPFWEERYCPAHDSDGTPKCCSCERLEPKERNYVKLGDGRWLCLECMESAFMDTYEVQPLQFEIREFFEGLNMKIEKEFPFLLVDKQALNKAEEEEKIDYQYEVVTRGICLSEAQTVTSVSKRPRIGPQNQLIGMVTESQRVVSDCEVTAILILYGLPRLMTGYILAHEMMHAYLRLNGYRNLNNVIEEGICQVLGHMWLESQTYAPINDATEAVASSSSSSHTPAGAATASKKGACSAFEKKLVEFCKNQIETDDSRVYGVGFREVNEMVSNSSLQETLKEIVRHRG